MLLNPPTVPQSKRLVNNVIFVVDESGSMSYHSRKVNEVMKSLADPLSTGAQETRVSVYSFSSNVKQEVFLAEPNVLRHMAHRASGQTALIDAAYNAIVDHQKASYSRSEDNSFLMYVITDGEENCSRQRPGNLAQLIASLPDNWTVATLVPDLRGVHAAKQAGFPAGNIETWNVNSATGFEEVGRRLADTYTNYTSMRSAGVNSTKSLFLDTKNLTTKAVAAALVEDHNFKMYVSDREEMIRDFVERVTGKAYQLGSTYYELLKTETIQGQKLLAVVNKVSGKRYSGDSARQLLGLPYYSTKVRPGDFGEWRIFVQSTSVNRKLLPGTSVLVK